jgi:hypothetical protein
VSIYLTIPEFKMRTIMPWAQIDRIETKLAPGWLEAQFQGSSSWVDMRLSKRYRVPFAAPYPEQVRSWVARMVTLRAYLQHGIPATDQQIALVTADAEKAEAEVKEAADGQLGLIDLAPSEQLASAVQYGGTRVYSEASPYVGYDVQHERARREDRNRRGT